MVYVTPCILHDIVKILSHVRSKIKMCIRGFHIKMFTAFSFFGVSGGLAMLPSDLMCRELQLGLGDKSRVLAVVLIPLGD